MFGPECEWQVPQPLLQLAAGPPADDGDLDAREVAETAEDGEEFVVRPRVRGTLRVRDERAVVVEIEANSRIDQRLPGPSAQAG